MLCGHILTYNKYNVQFKVSDVAAEQRVRGSEGKSNGS